jgi:ABC-type amino acid transport substrate-binding protein
MRLPPNPNKKKEAAMKPNYLCLLAACAIAPVHAESYVIGVENIAFAPHYSIDEQGRYQGFAREVFDLFAAKTGVQLTYKPLSIDALLPALLNGEVDFKYPDNRNWSGLAKTGKTVHYSQTVVNYVDGVLVAPKRVGLGVDHLKRLSIVDGWTPWGYEQRIESQQVLLLQSEGLRQMIRQALLKDTDGAYFNVVVATHYLDNIRAKPGALVFDPGLPHTRSTYNLSTIRHPKLIERFDRFLVEQHEQIAELKTRYGVEANLNSEYMGMEQWKVDFLKRQKARESAGL